MFLHTWKKDANIETGMGASSGIWILFSYQKKREELACKVVLVDGGTHSPGYRWSLLKCYPRASVRPRTLTLEEGQVCFRNPEPHNDSSQPYNLVFKPEKLPEGFCSRSADPGEKVPWKVIVAWSARSPSSERGENASRCYKMCPVLLMINFCSQCSWMFKGRKRAHRKGICRKGIIAQYITRRSGVIMSTWKGPI